MEQMEYETPSLAEKNKDLITTGTLGIVAPFQGFRNLTGLAADSTGVKAESGRFKINTSNLNSVTLRATWTASATDSVTAIELYDVTSGTVIGSVSGNTGTDSETSISVSSITSGDLFELRVEVTTASATSGATTDVNYGVLELEY